MKKYKEDILIDTKKYNTSNQIIENYKYKLNQLDNYDQDSSIENKLVSRKSKNPKIKKQTVNMKVR